MCAYKKWPTHSILRKKSLQTNTPQWWGNPLMLLLARVEWIQSERSTSSRKPTLVGQWGPQTLPNALYLTKQSSEDCSTQQEGISLYKAPALILYH